MPPCRTATGLAGSSKSATLVMCMSHNPNSSCRGSGSLKQLLMPLPLRTGNVHTPFSHLVWQSCIARWQLVAILHSGRHSVSPWWGEAYSNLGITCCLQLGWGFGGRVVEVVVVVVLAPQPAVRWRAQGGHSNLLLGDRGQSPLRVGAFTGGAKCNVKGISECSGLPS